MGGFPGRLDFHVVHQLLAAGQPGSLAFLLLFVSVRFVRPAFFLVFSVSEPDALRGGLPLHYKCVRRPDKCCE